MTLKATRFLSLLLVALTFGMAFCHVMEIPGKLRLNGAQWLTVQQHLYIAFGLVGAAIEGLSIFLTWLVVFQVYRRRSAFYWTLGAAICVTAGLIVWALLVASMNAALSGWTPETLPADWTDYRNQWETGQAIHAALFGLGFSALAIALLGDISNKAIR
jgi:hypothetical protein